MPIDYKEYHPDWKAISLRIRKERAGDKCEWCGEWNGEVVRVNKATRLRERAGFMSSVHSEALNYARALNDSADDGLGRWHPVVLTVAHIDHDKTNNDESNLAALCQRCHLGHDRKHNENNRRYGRNWKRDQWCLFDGT
jgi:hypothetical protein